MHNYDEAMNKVSHDKPQNKASQKNVAPDRSIVSEFSLEQSNKYPDTKRDIETAIQNRNFALAEAMKEMEESDITLTLQHIQEGQHNKNQKPKEHEKEEIEEQEEYSIPNTVRNVMRKCHIVSDIVIKAKVQQYLSFAEKTHLLQIFHCLGIEGAAFIHHVLSNCEDYDYAETQRRISRYGVNAPVGCKKLLERIGDDARCICNFSKEMIYPTPIIHALRVDPDCFKLPEQTDNDAHLKEKNPKSREQGVLSSGLELSGKQHKKAKRKKATNTQTEELFERKNSTEIHTPQGILIRTDEGIFIREANDGNTVHNP